MINPLLIASFLALLVFIPINIYSIENLENSIAFDPFSGFDGRFEGKSVGHFEYEKKCLDNVDDWILCKVVVDNEILLRGNLLNIDKNSPNIDKYNYIPTPQGLAWGACYGTVNYYNIKTDKLIGSFPYSAPVVYGPGDFGISSSGKISTTKNFENVSVGFSTNDPAMKQCIGEIRGTIDLRKIDTNVYSSRDAGTIEKADGYIKYNWISTLLHPNANIETNNKNNSLSTNKIDNDIQLIFQTSEDPVPNRRPVANVQVSPSNTVDPGVKVILNGNGSKDPDPGDQIIKYQWQPVGNNIILNSTSSPAVEFIAPRVTQATLVTFSLTVFDLFLMPSNPALAHITIEPTQGDFSITCLPGAKVLRGSSGDTPCFITSLEDFNRHVDLRCEPPINEPSITCSVTPSSRTPPSNGNVPFTLTVTTTKDTPVGNYNVNLIGRSGIIEHSITVPTECDICFPPRTASQDTSIKGTKFIKDREGFNGDGLIKRDCTSTIKTQCHVTHDRYGMYQDSGGDCTIGYGSKLRNGPCSNVNINNYNTDFPNGITEFQASTLLEAKINTEGEGPVNRNIKVKLTQEQFDALVSFSYNVGQGNFFKSDLRKDINKENCFPNAITEDFLKHITDKKGNVLPGLIDRRNAEAEIFNDNIYRDKSGNIIQ